MDNAILDRAFNEAVAIAHRAGSTIQVMSSEPHDIQRKQGFDIVTEADTRAESMIVGHLRAIFPDHVFSSEELAARGSSPATASGTWRWVIDPLDGTINYANHIPFSSVSLALQYNGETAFGVIYQIQTGTMYTARKGQGAYKGLAYDGLQQGMTRLVTSPERSLGNAVLTFMLTSHYSEQEIDRAISVIRGLASKTRGLRLWVSQAVELAYIAEGKLQGTVGIKSRGFSAAAGVLLVREAGGRVTDLSGIDFGNDSRSLVASNGLLHDDILVALRA